jgi:hypothetical protein
VNPWPIAPLAPKDLDFAIVNYGFTDLTAGDLGPLPPLESFLDSSLLDFAASIADQTVLIDSMAGDLDDLFSILNELGSDDFTSVLADLGTIASAGDSLLNSYIALFPDSGTPPSPPAPTPTPTPPTAPTAGGGGGGGSGPGDVSGAPPQGNEPARK